MITTRHLSKKCLVVQLQASEWVIDSASDDCQQCGARFTFFNRSDSFMISSAHFELEQCITCIKLLMYDIRRHHCRACGQLLCGDCSSSWAEVKGAKENPARICKLCVARIAAPASKPSCSVV